MLEKINQNFDNNIIADAIKKSNNSNIQKDKEFQILIEENALEEKRILELLKKNKKFKNNPPDVLLMHSLPHFIKISKSFKLKKISKLKCCKCNRKIKKDEKFISISSEEEKNYICSYCLNGELSSFLDTF